MLYETVNKLLNWGIKLASLAVTGPATWLVANELFHDSQSPMLLFVMKSAAVFLIEGVMLSNWLLLEFDRSSTPEIKARYGLTALAMYITLLVIAWQHEGPAGIVFRFALLAALLGSIYDSGVHTMLTKDKATDRDIRSDWTVKRHRRNRERELAKLRIDHEFVNEKAVLETDSFISEQKRSLDKEQRIAAVSSEHRSVMTKLSQPEKSDSFPYPIQKAQRRRTRQQQVSREEALNRIVDVLRDNPSLSLRQLGQAAGIGHETARRHLETLEEQGRIRRNGHVSITG